MVNKLVISLNGNEEERCVLAGISFFRFVCVARASLSLFVCCVYFGCFYVECVAAFSVFVTHSFRCWPLSKHEIFVSKDVPDTDDVCVCIRCMCAIV